MTWLLFFSQIFFIAVALYLFLRFGGTIIKVFLMITFPPVLVYVLVDWLLSDNED